MCGIVGTYGFADETLLRRMCQRLMHRGPDEEGVYVGESVGLAIRRLSIIDVEGGHQPIPNETRTVWVVQNGEIYNFRELRAAAEARGHRFVTRSDTEVIAHLYEDYGDDFVDHLRGMFAIAVWDARRRRLVLIRDRLGIKPLYYAETPRGLLFASEAKAILDALPSTELDPEALHHYLSFGYVPAPWTIFREIRKLLPGHRLVADASGVRIGRYWTLRPRPPMSRTQAELYEEVRHEVADAVTSHLVSDVPVGLFLSGGIDSSAILAFMTRASTRPVRTFTLTFGAEARGYDESSSARLVAERFGARHTEVPVTPQAFHLLPRILRHFDEPMANGTAALIYQLSGHASREMKVVLAGTGGDEAFGGYTRYAAVQWAARYARVPHALRRVLARVTGIGWHEAGEGRHVTRRLRRFLENGVASPEEQYAGWMTMLPDSSIARMSVAGAPMSAGAGSSAYLHALLDGADGTSLDFRIFRTDVGTYLANNQLEYNEKMSSAHGLEMRVPFCDHRLIEFCAAIPLATKIRGFTTKHLLREALRPVLPPGILSLRKVGLNPPYGVWFRTSLRPALQSILGAENVRRRGLFRPASVTQLVGEHLSGSRDHGPELWLLVVLEVWARMFLDGLAPEAALEEAELVEQA